MTIGRPQGAVWIGKPLDVVIPISLDAGDSGDSLCLGAEVLQGDTPLLERRVSVSQEPGGSPGQSSIRVRTTVPVDEPVVTVSLRAGCDMKSTRSYTLLADVPSDIALPGVAVAGARPSFEAAPPPRPAPRTAPRAANGSGGTVGADGAAAPSTATRRAASRPSPERERAAEAPQAAAPAAPAPRRAAPVVPRTVPSARPAAAAPAKTEAVAAGPRLQVEALEPEPARNTGLKPTAQLAPPSAEDPARRAAAAALWGAMNPAAAEAQRDNQRMKDLEATLAALREQTARNERTLLEMRTELAQARESQFRNPLVYALLAALLLALLGLLLMWRANRRAASTAWWREAALKDEPAQRPRRLQRHGGLLDDDEPDPDSEPGEPARKRTLGVTTFGATPFAPLLPEDDDEDEAPPPPARAAEAAAVRPVNTEELFDVQQQSDFFLSLGQQDQAIAVLREHIAANPGTSALAYLDLLRIYHSLDRREDYARLAEEFERAFNADVPPFDKYTDTGRGLEHYRSTLARIESQWPAPGTLALIEELIFRKPGVHEEGAFDLAAYQELLLLYALAKEVIEPEPEPDIVAPAAAVAPPVPDDKNAPTATAPLWPDTLPPTMPEGLMPPLPSIYGTIDDRLHHDTVMVPAAPLPSLSLPEEDDEEAAGAGMPPRVEAVPELDLAEFDKTAYETMPVPIEPVKPPAPSSDPHVIDFELFDPETEAEIAPKSIKR